MPARGHCENCGCPIYEYGCVNCNEQDYIDMQENPREKGDDDGMEYGDPRDHREGRE